MSPEISVHIYSALQKHTALKWENNFILIIPNRSKQSPLLSLLKWGLYLYFSVFIIPGHRNRRSVCSPEMGTSHPRSRWWRCQVRTSGTYQWCELPLWSPIVRQGKRREISVYFRNPFYRYVMHVVVYKLYKEHMPIKDRHSLHALVK